MRCMNEGCIHHSTTQMNYCMQYHDTDKCDEAEPRNLPEANVKPQLCDVRAELEKTLLSEDAPTLKQFEKWFAKGHNAAIKKALKIIDAHFA